VRGSGYSFQTEGRIREIQGQFDRLYKHRLGVGVEPSRAVALVNAIGNAQITSFNERMLPEIQQNAETILREWKAARETPARTRDEFQKHLISEIDTGRDARACGMLLGHATTALQYFPVSREQLGASEEEWEGLLRLIGFSKAERLRIPEPSFVRERPLFVLPDRRVLVVDVSSALDALWDAFEKSAREDAAFYSREYQRRAAKWVEQRAVTHLARIFPASGLYRTLDYADPTASGGANAELDAAVVWGPFLILVEAKAKQFRLSGQLGRVGHLQSDIKDNVEEAFKQAQRALLYVNSAERPVFKERGSGRTLAIDKSRLKRVYLLTVSLHRISTVTAQLAALKPLGLFRDDEYPFAIGEADFEVVAEHCPGPDVFLHYIERRLELHRVKPKVSADELDLFAAYLDTRFLGGRLWGAFGEVNGISLDGYADVFDRWAQHRWLGTGALPEIRLRAPDEILAVLAQLRQDTTDDARWIAFRLLNLARATLETLADAFRVLWGAPLGPDMGRTCVVCEGDMVVCVCVARGCSPVALRAQLEQSVSTEKYRRRASIALGFGVALEDLSRPFQVALLREGDWKPAAQMDALIEEAPLVSPFPGTKLPGRNEPCFCGSKQKFKRCCASRVARVQRGGTRR